MGKIKDVLVDCTGGTTKDKYPERIYIRSNNGRWWDDEIGYSGFYPTAKKELHETLAAATNGMCHDQWVVEYVAVTRYRCKVHPE